VRRHQLDDALPRPPPYAAPELYRGQATVGTDQYALCITFLKLCTGNRSFWPNLPDDAPPSGLPVDLSKLREREVPVIARALHPHAGSRWPSCRAFLEALRDSGEVARPPISFRTRTSRPGLPRPSTPAALRPVVNS
jgi:hypothetical protein